MGSRGRQKRRWSDLSPRQQAAVVAIGTVEITLALAAWTDLARRPAAQVRGPKLFWAFAIAVNIVGPINYFRFGRLEPAPDSAAAE